MDFAALLKMGVDTSQLVKGEDALDRLADAGAKTEKQTDRLNPALKRTERAAVDAADGVNKTARATDMLSGGMRSLAGVAGALTGALAGAFSIAGALQAAEQYSSMTNSLKAMGMTAGEASSSLKSITDIAMRTRAPLDATAQLYSRVSIAAGELGASQQDVLRFTENVGLALGAAGVSAGEASGALLQLSQAMAGGTVRAEEFNSILEGAYPLALAAARGIDEAGGSVGRLRQLVVEGKVSSEEFFQAILSQGDALKTTFDQTSITIGQAMTNLGTALSSTIGKMDQAVGASSAIASAIDYLAQNIGGLVSGAETLGGVLLVLAATRLPALALAGYGAASGMLAGASAAGVMAGAMTVLNGALALVGGAAGLIVGSFAAVGIGLYGARSRADELATALDSVRVAQDGLNAATEAYYSHINPANLEAMRAQGHATVEAIRSAIQVAEAELEAAQFFTNFFGVSLFTTDRMAAARAEINRLNGDLVEAEARMSAVDHAASNSTVSLREAQRAAQELAGSAPGPGWMGAAIGETNMLIGRLITAHSAASSLRAQNAFDQKNDVYSGRGGDPRQFMDGGAKPFVATKQIEEMADAMMTLTAAAGGGSGRGGGGGGGASGAIDELAQEVLNLNKQASAGLTPVDKYRKSLERLNDLKKKGLSDGAYSQELERINDEFANASPIVSTFTDAFTGFLDGSIRSFGDFTKSILNGFRKMLAEMIATALRNKIFIPMATGGAGLGGMASAATGGGGGLGGLLGGGGGMLGGFGSSGSILGMGGLGGGAGLMGGLGNALSGGLGNVLNIGANAAAAGGGALASIGAALPVLGAVAVVFSLFKKKVTQLDSGVRTTITGMDALVETFSTTETKRFWGLSKKVRTSYTQAEANIANPVQQVIDGIGQSTKNMATSLGLSFASLESFAYQFQVSTKGMTDEQAQKAIQDALQGVSSGMAENILKASGGLNFVKDGEDFNETLTRLSTSLTAANGALDGLGHSLFRISLQGANSASKLVDAFGGLEKFTASTQAYFENYYTAQEQLEVRTNRLSDAFADANVRMPRSTEELRRMVEAQDLTTRRGRLVYATLMNLSGEFAALQQASEQLAEANSRERLGLEQRLLQLQGNTAELRRRELRELEPANRALQNAIWRLEDMRTAANNAEAAFKQSANAEQARIAEMRGMSERIRGMATSAIEATFGVSEAQRLSAERQLRLAVQTGKVWGSQLEALAETAMAVDASNFGSSLDFLRASARAAGVLASVSGAQASAAGTAEDRLEAALKKYGLQDATVLSLSESMRRLDGALSRLATAEAQAIRAMAGKKAIDAPYTPPRVPDGKRAMNADESQPAMQNELSEIKGFMRELVKISIKQERTLKQIELQGEGA